MYLDICIDILENIKMNDFSNDYENDYKSNVLSTKNLLDSILEVKKESPAEVYGLKQNDVLLNIDGNKVESLLMNY